MERGNYEGVQIMKAGLREGLYIVNEYYVRGYIIKGGTIVGVIY